MSTALLAYRAANPVASPTVILAVSASSRSGWALYLRGTPKMGDHLDSRSTSAVRRVVGIADSLAEWMGLPSVLRLPCLLVLDAERNAVAGERWTAAWRELGGAAAGIVSVAGREHCAAILGAGGAAASPDEARSAELEAARLIVGPLAGSLGHHEAAAVCVGYWAARAARLRPLVGHIGSAALQTAAAGGS